MYLYQLKSLGRVTEVRAGLFGTGLSGKVYNQKWLRGPQNFTVPPTSSIQHWQSLAINYVCLNWFLFRLYVQQVMEVVKMQQGEQDRMLSDKLNG
jgi:hypothetical protein